MRPSLWAHARAVRSRIRAGTPGPGWFRRRLLAVPAADRDTWAHEVLGLAEPPRDAADLPRGAVPYLPCGVSAILRMVDEAPLRPDDRFVDLGSGLGKVALLAHLLSGARATGVELQAALVEQARRAAAALGLAGAVRFVQADAALHAPEGNVFFIYAAFNGGLLERVLARLRERARSHALVLCAVDFEVGAAWLVPRRPPVGELTLYDARVEPERSDRS